MSAFDDDDPRAKIYDLLKRIREDHDLRGSRVVALALDALRYYAEELADARDTSEKE